jgi:hypothetical protein
MSNVGFLDVESNTRILSVKDFQLKNLWALTFEGLGADFDFYVTETNIPLPKISVEKTSFDLIVPENKEELGTYSMTFLETVDFQGFQFFAQWLNKVYNFEKRVFRSSFHSQKKQATIKFLSLRHLGIPSFAKAVLPGGNFAAISVPTSAGVSVPNIYFNLSGIMITGIEDISLDNDSGDPLTITVNFEIQKINYRSILNGIAMAKEGLQNNLTSLIEGIF